MKIDFGHRRQWIRDRLEKLAKIYLIDIVTFAIMHNHFHLLVRTRCDVVAELTDEEVVRRLLRLEYDRWYHSNGDDKKKTKAEIAKRINDRKQMAKDRARLSDISKFMQSLNQHIAIKANKEEGNSGRFFERRFGHNILADQADVLACAMYIDLNPIRAGIAMTPEDSEFTGAYERIADLSLVLTGSHGTFQIRRSDLGEDVFEWERIGGENSGWLSPIGVVERLAPEAPDIDRGGRRGSRKGVLEMNLWEYLDLLDFTGRQIKEGKQGAIPDSAAPLFDRLGFSLEHMNEIVASTVARYSAYARATERGGRPDCLPESAKPPNEGDDHLSPQRMVQPSPS